MESLLRRTFAVTVRQMAFLKERAESLGISIADVMRRILDEHIDKQ